MITNTQFTAEEQSRIRSHLGFQNVTEQATLFFGTPGIAQLNFVVNDAMARMQPQSYPRVRQLLDVLDGMEVKMVETSEYAIVSRVGNIDIRPDANGSLISQYLYWRNTLANEFGCQPNPYDQRFGPMGFGGINVRVNGG